jgi:hypothetical protein
MEEKMYATEKSATAQLPRTVWIVLTCDPHSPAPENVGPLILPFPPIGFGMPIFGDKELAESFVASPSFDIPGVLKEMPLKYIVRGARTPSPSSASTATRGNIST